MKKIITALLLGLFCSAACAQKMTVRGQVVDEKGEPIPGAAVVDKQKTGNGVVADLDGKFTINVASDGFI